MDLIRYASRPDADVALVERELERILPDLPMVSLNGVVDGPEYVKAVDAIDRVARGDTGLARLQIYLSSS